MKARIVLFEPEIPQNTGNIARTCAATGLELVLIEPLGFRLEDRYLKRAGLDYWDKLRYRTAADMAGFLELQGGAPLYYASTKGGRLYTDIQYEEDCTVMFGPESRGLPVEFLEASPNSVLRIPTRADCRSLNLSNAVAIVIYELLRQHGFPGLSIQPPHLGGTEPLGSTEPREAPAKE
ncbi:MAG: tRNA (cytidine(34)-2'-O)-methyltransferase [Spirochaetaceae bacterium]|nr:MAG: tRNA (cytidine(34)-2'-O)-methyltransferase [Spirochaetaceae bacterium]